MPNLTEQLKREGHLLTRSKPKEKAPRKRIPAMSAKRAKQNAEYYKRRKVYLEKHPFCQIWLKRNDVSESEAIDAYMTLGSRGVVQGFDLKLGMVFWEVGQIPRSNQIHHSKKPKCKYLNDESTWFAACPQEHEWVESNKSTSRKLGLLCY